MASREAKPKKIWDNCKVIGEVNKSERTKLRVELTTRDGVKYINIREWYMTKKDLEWKPGISGFAIPLLLPIEGELMHCADSLMVLMTKCVVEAPEFPLEDEANAVWSIPKNK